ncbi:hypothetical protein DL96DRAFT_1277858 [Flagelloscypha sp. PMI_526]|nr:hypothetical protein DL96DRAFT_1277858 [Flagelloscypha sp. PMI_526]
MGCWDVYDIITGFSARGGPTSFLEGAEKRDEFADGLSDKILAAAQYSNLPCKHELKQILIDALVYVSDEAGKEKVSFPYSSRPHYAVFGKFGEDDDDDTVTIRYCKMYDAYGGFDRMLDSDGEWKYGGTQLNQIGSPFMDYRCWHYLRAWVDYPKNPRMSFEEAFYRAFTNGVNLRAPGIAMAIDYGLMRFMWGQFQDSFLENCSAPQALKFLCLETVPNLSAAISYGLRGKYLATAVFSDFQTWIFATPDLWPHKPDRATPVFRTFETTLATTPKILTLPVELILKISSLLSLADILTASYASKSMHQLVTGPYILPLRFRDMITSPNGPLRWIQPCSSVEGELDRANEALCTWINTNSKDCDSPFYVPDFPFVEFVHTCLVISDSMKSRKRIWGIIKRVELLLGEKYGWFRSKN